MSTTPHRAETPPSTDHRTPRRRRWLVLVPLLLLGSLLWVSNWFYQRSRLFTAANVDVVFGEPRLPWGVLIGDVRARELFGAPVKYLLPEQTLTPYQIGIIGGYTSLKSLQLRGVTDADVRRLKGLTNLEELTLNAPQLTDEACEIIGRFDKLKRLTLSNDDESTRIEMTDQGLSHLVGLTQLRGLELPAPGVTDDGLKTIAKLQTLTGLDLDGTGLPGEGLGDLTKLTNLEALFIRNWSPKEHALNDLPKLGNFRALGLLNCSLPEDCLRPLEACPLFRQLSLSGSNVSDAMLEDLTSIRSLAWLCLEGTNVSRKACERFHLSRPDVSLTDAAGRRVVSQPEGQ